MESINQFAFDIMNSERWRAFPPSRVIPEARAILHGKLVERLLDFVCILHFKTDYESLLACDEGKIKLRSIFPDALQHSAILARYQQAMRDQDAGFLKPWQKAEESKIRRLDTKTLAGPKSLLFLNWYTPLMFPERNVGLIVQTNTELSEWIRPRVLWDENRIKTELSRLKLSHEDKSRMVPISAFLLDA